ncbi:MAG: hypothetical protein KDB23_33930, partial [Planctomycetales bacterium]|nr:hypothetical protein [Planctomycetales bacterium]
MTQRIERIANLSIPPSSRSRKLSVAMLLVAGLLLLPMSGRIEALTEVTQSELAQEAPRSGDTPRDSRATPTEPHAAASADEAARRAKLLNDRYDLKGRIEWINGQLTHPLKIAVRPVKDTVRRMQAEVAPGDTDFQFRRLTPGDYVLSCQSDEIEEPDSRVVTIPSDALVELKLQVVPPTYLRGQVIRGQDGAPVSRYRL